VFELDACIYGLTESNRSYHAAWIHN